MVKLTQLILHFGDEMNVEQNAMAMGQANSQQYYTQYYTRQKYAKLYNTLLGL